MNLVTSPKLPQSTQKAFNLGAEKFQGVLHLFQTFHFSSANRSKQVVQSTKRQQPYPDHGFALFQAHTLHTRQHSELFCKNWLIGIVILDGFPTVKLYIHWVERSSSAFITDVQSMCFQWLLWWYIECVNQPWVFSQHSSVISQQPQRSWRCYLYKSRWGHF